MAEGKIILLEVDIKMDDAIANQKKLTEELIEAKKAADALKKSDGETSEAYIKKNAEVKAIAKELNTQRTITEKVIATNRANVGSLDEMRAALVVVSKRWSELSEDERKNTEEGQKLTAQKLKLKDAITAEEVATGTATGRVGFYEDATKSLKLELRENITTLARMKAAGEDSSEAYKKLVKVTGELQDTIADTREEIKRYASDTQELDQAIAVFQGIGAAAQIAEGASALLGGENEQLTKSIQKMVAIQGIMNGLQEIQNALQKESAFTMAVNNVQTKAMAAGQAIYATAVGTSTGAMKVFRTALLATGIGALIVAIGLLVVNWTKLSNAIDGSAKAQEDYNKELERLNRLKESNQSLDELSLKIKQELGFKESEISKQELENSKNKQIALQKEIDLTSNKKKLTEEESAAQEKRFEELKKLQDEQILLNIRIPKQQKEEEDKAAKEISDNKKKQTEEQKKKAEEITNKLYDELVKRKEAEQAWEDFLIESAKIQDQARIDQAVKRVQSDRERRKAEKERLKAVAAEDLENEMQIRILQNESEFTLQREFLAIKEEEEIKAAEKLGSNVLLIQQKYSLAKIQIDKAETAARMTAYAGMAGNIAELFGKQTKIGKIAASAQTAINTYLGAQSVFAQTPGGIVIKSIAAGLATAVGLKNIAAIWAVKSGLPGDGGGGTTTAPAGGVNVNPSIGQGIVSRETPQNTNQVNVNTQPTLVIDKVTEAQQQQNRINQTQSI